MGRKLTPRQLAAAMRNIKLAQAAVRRQAQRGRSMAKAAATAADAVTTAAGLLGRSLARGALAGASRSAKNQRKAQQANLRDAEATVNRYFGRRFKN